MAASSTSPVGFRSNILLAHLMNKPFGVEGQRKSAVEYAANASSRFPVSDASSPTPSREMIHLGVNTDDGD